MTHDELQIIKISKFLYQKGYTCIHFERTNDLFQDVIILRACLLHSYGNKKLKDELPQVYAKLKPMIDCLNLTYFIKNPKDRKKYNIS